MSAKPFLITGLPRSRTAWMTAFFCTGSILCKHEPLKELFDITEAARIFQSEYHSHVGASDSGAGFFLPWIMENINPPTVIIERNLLDVKASMLDIGLPMGSPLNELARKLDLYRNHPNVLWVSFASLNDKRIMQKVWFHLIPGVPFNDERYEVFRELHIEADIPKVKAFAVANHSRQAHMLRDVLKGD